MSTPVPVSDLEDLSRIASQPCVPDDVEGYEPSPAMVQSVENQGNFRANDSTNLIRLIREMGETIDRTNGTHNAIKHWMLPTNGQNITDIVNYVRDTLRIPLTQHSGLSAEENSRLHVLLQFSNYAFFLKKLENDSASGNNMATLHELRLSIMQAACTLRRLLPQVLASDVKTYAKQDLAGHTIPIVSQKAGVKRLVCCLAVEMMLNTFIRIEVNIDESSVIIHGNV